MLIAGGLCGTTMLRAAQMIEEACMEKDVYIDVRIHNLWESAVVDTNCDIVIEMFPFFKGLSCPVLSGKPFINMKGEKELIVRIVSILKGE